MQKFLSYTKYELCKTVDEVAFCPLCDEFTESDALIPELHGLPSFVICWNCHDVRQAGVGSIRDAELTLERKTDTCPSCEGSKIYRPDGTLIKCIDCNGTGQV